MEKKLKHILGVPPKSCRRKVRKTGREQGRKEREGDVGREISSIWLKNFFTSDGNQIMELLLRMCLRPWIGPFSVKALIRFIAKLKTM